MVSYAPGSGAIRILRRQETNVVRKLLVSGIPDPLCAYFRAVERLSMTTIQRAWWTILLVVVVSTVAVNDVCGQMGFGQQGYPAPQPGMMYQGGYSPGVGLAPVAYGPGPGYAMPATSYIAMQPVVEGVPAYYQEPVASEEDESPEAIPEDEYYTEANYPRRRHRTGSLMYGILGLLAPYGEGGCCAPHWFDIHAEFLHLGLDDHAPFIELSQDTGFTTRITSSDLQYGHEPGFRVTGTYQTGPGSNLEFTYLGMLEYNEAQTATGVDELNSIFTDFTNDDPMGQGQEQFDQADLHRVYLEDDFDSLELNYRRRWVGQTCLLQGSWMVGLRHVKLKERFRFTSVASRDTDSNGIDDTGGEGYCRLNASNYMTGPQIGGDIWLCLLPGLNVGVDGKFALFGNNAKQHTSIFGIDTFNTPSYVGIVPSEVVGNDTVSFLGELSFNVNYRVNHRLTFRAGYELILVEGVALAMENFNPDIPLFTAVPRTPTIWDNGSLFYDGWTFGAELMW